MNPLQQLQDLGQSVWLDYIRRDLLASGELSRLIEQGLTGVTSNPSIFEKAIVDSAEYDAEILDLSKSNDNAKAIYEALAIEDIRAAADALRPVYDRLDGADGFVSFEVSPLLAHDTDGTLAEARRLFKAVGRPNVMIKIPGTPAGVPAIRQLIGEGININVTLIFSIEAYGQVMDAYITGLETLASTGGDVSSVGSVASFFVSRVDTLVDGLLGKAIQEGQDGGKKLLGKAAVANAKLAYQAFQETFGADRFSALKANGARVQRPLWASTSTKNPAYSDLLYVEPLVGADTVNTMPPPTLDAFLDHGKAESLLEQNVAEAGQVLAALATEGINMSEVTDKLLADGVKAFADSFDHLLANLDGKRRSLLEKTSA
ncbi:MAG: transaldolase / glucose-6-phosphate isomerase [Chloroflexi bacterium]|jgi:transaldolase/glucose-6-phosphate isomerase|nr:MAG: transaldolase / glucose-6-phosphate isomerase [Chloroflexota bacterium]